MTNITSAFYNYDETVEKSKTSYSGLLGLAINGNKIVNHPTRAGYVYVRLRDNLSEVVQAFNDKVSPVYDFPVLIQRKGNKWYVLGRDDLRYESWGTSAPYLPRHGDQHSFNRDGGGGGDVVWTYPDQFMPLLVYPSGTYGASNLLIAPYVLQKADKFLYVGNTGTANIVRYKPTNSNAIIGLVYLDRETGNPGFLINSGTPFAGSITGTNAIVPYLPYPSATQEPLYAFRLVSGTTSLTWDNLYNVRQFIGGSTSTGTSGGGGTSDHESLTGLLGGSANNHYHLTPSQVTGLVSGTSTTLHSHSGTLIPFNFVTGSIAFADTNGQLIEDNKHLRYNSTLRSVRMGKDATFNNFADLFPFFATAEFAGESIVNGVYAYGTGTFGLPLPGFGMYRSRGTVELPTPVQKDDVLGSIFGTGYDGEGFYNGGRVRFYADGNWVTGTYRPSRTAFLVTPSGTTSQIEKMVLYGDSLNLINTGTYNVNGSPHTHQLSDVQYHTLPEGVGWNYQIVPSVTSNNLTVALKGLDGNNASTTNPIKIRIGNVERTITAALSVTINAANTFNAGSSEFKTFEIDYATLLRYNATDGVCIGVSRIFYGNLYSDYSATSTNERYAAWNTITNAVAGDNVVVIGRFSAINSGAASYNWSVPTFTANNLINRPIFDTRWLSWQPAYTLNASATFTSVTTTMAIYKMSLNQCSGYFDFNGTVGVNSNGTILGLTPPFQIFSTVPGLMYNGCYINIGGAAAEAGYVRARAAVTVLEISRANEGGFTTGAGRYARGSLMYQIGG